MFRTLGVPARTLFNFEIDTLYLDWDCEFDSRQDEYVVDYLPDELGLDMKKVRSFVSRFYFWFLSYLPVYESEIQSILCWFFSR